MLSDEQWNNSFWMTERMKDWGIVEMTQHYYKLYRVSTCQPDRKEGRRRAHRQ